MAAMAGVGYVGYHYCYKRKMLSQQEDGVGILENHHDGNGV
jgi:hypothetical protein